MKTIAYFLRTILISLCILLVSCSQNGEFRLLDGNLSSLDDFRGKWVVINFWAEWCAPCIEEIPELNHLAAQGEELNVVVIGVSFDPIENEELSGLVNKLDIQYPVMATNPSPILPFALPPTLPTNYLLTPEGEVATKLVGTQSYETLVSALNKAKQVINQGK